MPISINEFEIFHPTLSEDEHTLILSLDHGKANEMGTDCLKAWEKVTAFLRQGTVQSVVVTSQRLSKKGKPIYIAGADVTERQGWSNDKVKKHVRWQRSVLADLRKVPVFFTTLVHGIALGWGTEFLLCCDYRVATPTARFGLPETSLGILPGAGGTSELWMEIGIGHAMRLGMTGEQITALESSRIGLVQEIADTYEDGLKRLLNLCQLANKRSPSALSAFKSALLNSRGLKASARGQLEAEAYEHCVDSGDAAVGRAHFKEIITGGSPPWQPFQAFNSEG